MSLQTIALLGLASLGSAGVTFPKEIFGRATTNCRALPGDVSWPSNPVCNALNKTLNGHLIASVPMASACHDAPFNNYNATLCAQIQASWGETKLFR